MERIDVTPGQYNETKIMIIKIEIASTLRRCKLVVGGSAMALKILADEGSSEASFCSTCNLSIHGFTSGRKYVDDLPSYEMFLRQSTQLVQKFKPYNDVIVIFRLNPNGEKKKKKGGRGRLLTLKEGTGCNKIKPTKEKNKS